MQPPQRQLAVWFNSIRRCARVHGRPQRGPRGAFSQPSASGNEKATFHVKGRLLISLPFKSRLNRLLGRVIILNRQDNPEGLRLHDRTGRQPRAITVVGVPTAEELIQIQGRVDRRNTRSDSKLRILHHAPVVSDLNPNISTLHGRMKHECLVFDETNASVGHKNNQSHLKNAGAEDRLDCIEIKHKRIAGLKFAI